MLTTTIIIIIIIIIIIVMEFEVQLTNTFLTHWISWKGGERKTKEKQEGRNEEGGRRNVKKVGNRMATREQRGRRKQMRGEGKEKTGESGKMEKEGGIGDREKGERRGRV